MNRLAKSLSPYLQQHAENPVNWYPWGDEALEASRSQNKPIFLSIGYSTCHWCHVMAHESFENSDIAEILNRDFISIKVDREERPDLDELYMDAVQMLSGSGGWPMSVFITPGLQPFYGGTYFPPENVHGRSGFRSILNQISDAWTNRNGEVLKSAGEISSRISRGMQFSGTKPSETVQEEAVKKIVSDFDEKYGGFGPAPKFPPSLQLSYLMRHYKRSKDSDVLNAVTTTLDIMGRGGLYDHIGGGFYRYSTDRKWLLPHFEKMLYDNALLTSSYLDAFQLTGNREYLRIAEDTLSYVEEKLSSPGDGFYSAEDADSEGEEGSFYLWSIDEITSILKEKSDEFILFFDIKKSGNFASHEEYHQGKNNLYGESLKYPDGIKKMLQILKTERDHRIRPGRDEKIITSWNGLMISAYADAYRVTGREIYGKRAVRAAEFILEKMVLNGKLHRIYRDGEVKQRAFLEDYTFLGNSFLQLYEATLDVRWIYETEKLAEIVKNDFVNEEGTHLYTTAEYHTNLITRKESLFDGVIPSGLSSGVRLFYRLSLYLKNDIYEELASGLLQNQAGLMERAPSSSTGLLAVSSLIDNAPLELTLSSSCIDEKRNVVRRINDLFLPDRHLYLSGENGIPAAEGKDDVGVCTLYRCENRTCYPPEQDIEKLLTIISR